jgi:hypothetical protein
LRVIKPPATGGLVLYGAAVAVVWMGGSIAAVIWGARSRDIGNRVVGVGGGGLSIVVGVTIVIALWRAWDSYRHRRPDHENHGLR